MNIFPTPLVTIQMLMSIFVETWCDQDSCLDISWEGFEGFHCVRANSQLHGGITVLLKAWMCHHGVRVSSDPRAGIRVDRY